jgi:hypothetical protein
MATKDLSGNTTPKKEEPKTPPKKELLPALPLHRCLRCGYRGHFTVACRAETDIRGNVIIEEDEGYTSDKYY